MRGTKGTKQGRGGTAALQRAVAAVALFGAAAGCTTEQGNRALVIVQNQVPTAEGTACTIPAKRTEVTLPRGLLDVSFVGARYDLYPLVTNLLPAFMDTDPYNPSLVSLRGFDVTIEPPPGVTLTDEATCPVSFRTPAQGVLLQPMDEVASAITAMLPCHTDKIRTMYLDKVLGSSADVVFTLKVRARGDHGGGDLTKSDEFVFPVQVCYGCLQRGFSGVGYTAFGFDPVSGNTAYPRCDQLTENPYTGNACNISQDSGPVLCCSVDGTAASIECPGTPRGVKPATTP